MTYMRRAALWGLFLVLLGCESGAGGYGFGAEGLDLSLIWTVRASEANIASDNNGIAWDADNSAPDVVVYLTCPPASAGIKVTSAQSESFTPHWIGGGCQANGYTLLDNPIVIRLIDRDVISDDSITGNVSFQLKEFHLMQGFVNLGASGGMNSLTLSIEN